jgi:hypothetical protein
LFFNRIITQYTSRLCKVYLTKKESDGELHQMTWPPQSPDLNPIEMVWDELDRRVKEKHPTSAPHMWKYLQDCWKSIPGEAGWENAKSVQSWQRVDTLKNRKSKIYFDLFNSFFGCYMIPYVLFQNCDVFTIILQCRK